MDITENYLYPVIRHLAGGDGCGCSVSVVNDAICPFLNTFLGKSRRFLGAAEDGAEEIFEGVHVCFLDVWFAMLFLMAIWVFGFLGERGLRMPSLVGQIFAGIIFGPEVANIVPYTKAFVLLGEIGLVLLVVEAGVDIDVMTLKLIGKRGVIIAILGSIFPIGLGIAIAYAVGVPDDKAAIAAGLAFGPTSLGIAMNILKTGKIINTPTGQLIVAAAIIDDMIALILLSVVDSLGAGSLTFNSVGIPMIMALGFLVLGGYVALFMVPPLLEKFVFKEDMDPAFHGRLSLGLMVFLILSLFLGTLTLRASHLMGAFLAGLVFCTDHELHVAFVSQLKRVLQWLMRIFFATTIGFQVPVTKFGSGKVIWKGLVFTLALLGKLGVGFFVPNFTQSKKFTGNHLRDCLIVGCSMAAEGEFAFVLASAAIAKGILDPDTYSSIVLAILLSTIIAPFSLRFTIDYFNKKNLKDLEEVELLHASVGDVDDDLRAGILEGSTVFFCINITSHGAWGTLPRLMQTLFDLKLDVIDHRSWHSRFESTVVNEVYCQGHVTGGTDLDVHIHKIFDNVTAAINQKDAVISVSRWTPGVVENLAEDTSKKELAERVCEEARVILDKHVQKTEKTDQMMMSLNEVSPMPDRPVQKSRRKHVRVLSTPSGGGDMFAEQAADLESRSDHTQGAVFQPSAPIGGNTRRRRRRTVSTPLNGDMFGAPAPVLISSGEVLVNVMDSNGKKYPIKMKEELLTEIRRTQTPMVLEKAQKEEEFTGRFLDGFVRKDGKSRAFVS